MMHFTFPSPVLDVLDGRAACYGGVYPVVMFCRALLKGSLRRMCQYQLADVSSVCAAITVFLFLPLRVSY